MKERSKIDKIVFSVIFGAIFILGMISPESFGRRWIILGYTVFLFLFLWDMPYCWSEESK